MYPLKRLGQSFLKDTKVLERIAAVSDIAPGDTVVEIGAGHGELTRRLLSYEPGRLIVIEKDHRMIDYYLKPLSSEHAALEIVVGDALVELPGLAESLGEYIVVGNIPYYIAGALLRLLGQLAKKPKSIVLTVQKEVALRAAAEPPKMNLLAASLGFWADSQVVRYVGRRSFRPVPRVDSAILKIVPRESRVETVAADRYYRTLHVLFNQPRKTIWNNLKAAAVAKEAVISLGIDPKLRPQNLSISQIEQLATLFTE